MQRLEGFAPTLRAAQEGAEWAVARLYRSHHSRILRYLRAQAPGHEDDLASETWLAAARNLRAFTGGEDDFAGWLFTIAHRRLVDHRRAQRRRPSEAAPPEKLEAWVKGAASSAEEAALEGRLADEAAAELVALLPPEQAEVLLLRVVGGLSAEAVGRITGHRAGTVRVIQHRGLERLAQILGDGRNDREEDSDGTGRDAHAPTSPRRRHR